MPLTPQMMKSPLAEATRTDVNSITAANSAHQPRPNQKHQGTTHEANERIAAPTQHAQVNTSSQEPPEEKPYVNCIRILTTSLPIYHNQLMKAKKKDEERKRQEQRGETLEPREVDMLAKMSLEVGSGQQSKEQQEETIRRLKPHSRSTVQIHQILNTASQNPEEAAAHTAKSKPRSTKWQFGIRSKNEPIDAIKCLYKALETMGDCQWEVTPSKSSTTSVERNNEGPYPVNVHGATHIPSGDSNLSESPEKDRHQAPEAQRGPGDGASGPHHPKIIHRIIEDGSDSENDSDVDVDNPPDGYFPKDPWVIHVRWEKKGMCPPGAINSNSAQSSRVDLVSSDGFARRSSVAMGSLSSAGDSAISVTGATEPQGTNYNDSACFVYLDLQIYSLEMEVYLVDFKCAGYESIIGSKEVINKKGETVTEYIGSGIRVPDKNVTSPQPFMDLANKLVIYLANKN